MSSTISETSLSSTSSLNSQVEDDSDLTVSVDDSDRDDDETSSSDSDNEGDLTRGAEKTSNVTSPRDHDGPNSKDSLQGPYEHWRRRLKPVTKTESGRAKRVEGVHGQGGLPIFERTLKDRRNLPDDSEGREKRRSLPVIKRPTEKRGRGPMIAKQPMQHQGSSGTAACGPGSSGVTKHRSGAHLESVFTRQVVHKAVSPGVPRKKLNLGSSQTRIPLPADKRGSHGMTSGVGASSSRQGAASPAAAAVEGAASATDSNNKRVEKVLKARLYLLQQTGPNSFLIGGDSPDHKYRVIIGPQRCSCGRGPHCVHVLFVMLRVFQIRENDHQVWTKTLKNYEVEALFRNFHARRTQRITDLRRRPKPRPQEEHHGEPQEHEHSDSEEHADEQARKEEEETCPICLLEMVEGESLTECHTGCQNKLHHHCIAVWFEECKRQKEKLVCPLCRTEWKGAESGDVNSQDELPTVPPNTRAASPQAMASEADTEIQLPYSEPILPENAEKADAWTPVLGEDVVGCLFSKNWVAREVALKQMGRLAVGELLLGVGEGRLGVMVSPTRQASTHSMLECCCSVLTHMCGDPVYKVFVAALRTLRTVLAYTPCRDENQLSRLQQLLTPVVDTILLKCADSNKRTSQLSVSALQELVKGQEGELAVGKEIVSPGNLDLGGVSYLLTCILKDYSVEDARCWQWLLGRLYMLDKLVEESPSEFTIKVSRSSPGHHLDAGLKYDRVMSMLNFFKPALSHTHAKVGKMARRIFYLVAKLQAQSHGVLKEISELLDDVETNVQVYLKRRMLRFMGDYQLMPSQVPSAAGAAAGREVEDDELSIATTMETPIASATSSPRCGSPVLSTSPVSSVGGLSMIPMVPPNSPHIKGSRFRRTSENSDVDSVSQASMSSQGGADSGTGSGVASGLLTPPGTPRGLTRRLNRDDPQEHQLSEAVQTADACVATSPSLQARRPMHGAGEARIFPEDIPEASTSDEEGRPFFFIDEAPYDSHDIANSVDLVETLTPSVFCSPAKVSGDGDSNSQHEDSVAPEDSVSVAHNNHAATSSSTSTSVSHIPVSMPCSAIASCPNPPSEENLDLEHFNDLAQPLDGQQCGSKIQDSISEASVRPNVSSPTALLTEDLSDLALSPTGPEDRVSFKTEVATRHQLSLGGGSDELCPCKEEVEKEEAEALAEALQRSEMRQDTLPFVPGLSRGRSEETLAIHVQDQPSDLQVTQYSEGMQWVRGPVLGTGAFSTCYQARDVKTGTLMAVKQISFCRNSIAEQQRVVEAVQEEIEMMAKLNHPNIVRILGATQQGCHYFMFVEWMPGGSVAYLLDRYGAFQNSVIVHYTQQVLRGLAYLHEHHMLHRDLKGANLLVDSTGQRIRIGDFGASARLASRSTGAGEFQGQLLGTVAFMAPEVLRGESYGRSCDIWGVGCTIIEMATTKPPWGASDISNHLALIFKIASTAVPPPIPEHLPPPVRDLLLRCLECKRDERPTASDLLKHPLFTMYHKKV